MIAAHPFSPNELGVLIHKYKYTNIQIHKYTNTNIDIEIHIYKRKHHKLYVTDYTAPSIFLIWLTLRMEIFLFLPGDAALFILQNLGP